MVHNFSKKRYPIIPDRIPKYHVKDTVRVISNQHVLYGKYGEVTAVYPAQSNVFYKLLINGKEHGSLPERMLKLTRTGGN